MAKHLKLHSFTGTTDHDFTGLVANQLLEFNGTNVQSISTSSAGNVLFVSASGDDATAVKGDLLHPYASLYAAKTASTSGDTVYVLPQTIVYDNRNTAGNPYNGQVDTLVNLWKDGVTYYFAPDTKIRMYNQTVSGNNMYLFSPGASTGETCTVLGYLDYEQNSTGADTSNGANYFYFNNNASEGGSTFFAKLYRLASNHCEPIFASLYNTGTTTDITIVSELEYWDYLGGQTSVGGFYFINANTTACPVNFKAYSKYREYTTDRAYAFYFSKDFTNAKIDIYGEKIDCERQLFLLRDMPGGLFNISVDDIYYGNGYTPFGYQGAVLSTFGSTGGWTLNMNANLYDLTDNSLTTGLFVPNSTNNTINFKGNITTKTSSGVGRYIVSTNATGNEVNIDGDITHLGDGTTTQIFFQANGANTKINYTGKISGNFASGIARPRNGGVININNSYIESEVDGSNSSVFQNSTTVLGTGRLNNSFVRLTNNTNGVVDGEDNNIFINNSTVINLGTGSTVAYNTTDNGDLQVVNSTLISSYSGATSIAYTGATTVIATNSTVNTNYDINDFKGNINILTDLTY